MTKAIETPVYRQSTLISSLGTFPSGFVSRILVAIPCYNEELTIGSVVLKTKKYNEDILIVDDGSTDDTADIARRAGALVISHPENRGKGASIFSAVQYAKKMDYDVLVLLDGDGQHNPEEIPGLLYPILKDNKDFVIGSRFHPNGNGKNGIPFYRRLGQISLDIATNSASNCKSTDSQSGFRALSREALSRFTILSEEYNIESDMITNLAEQGLSITEVPISVRYDTPNGHKKSPFYHGFDILSHIVGVISYKRPLLAFGVPGLALTLSGLFLGFYALSIYYSTGAFHYILFMGGTVALILGLLFVTAGFIMNSIAHVIQSQKI